LIGVQFGFSSYFPARFWRDFVFFFTRFIAWSFLLIWLLLSFVKEEHPELFSFPHTFAWKSYSYSGTYVSFTHSQVEYQRFSINKNMVVRTLIKNYTYLLNFFLISLFQISNITSSFLCLFNLFPGFHFFLFQKSNTICQKLCITIDTIETKG